MIYKTKVVIFDIDGVLADFDLAFTTLAHKLFDTPVVTCFGHHSWNFRTLMTDAQQSETWEVLKEEDGWWDRLECLCTPHEMYRLAALCDVAEVYFVTHRMHNVTPVGEQSVMWLQIHGIDNPRVIVSSRKGEIASAVCADYAIEDNWGNACSIHWMAEKCKTFLIARPYNEEARKIIPPNITVVNTISQYLDAIKT